jgi:hypothetical protein
LAREVEKPILDSLYFKERRFFSRVPNKRKRVPPLDGLHLQTGLRVQANADMGEGVSIDVGVNPDANEARLIKDFLGQTHGTLIFPIATTPGERALARFVGKVGLELLASRLIKAGMSHEELVDKPEFEALRKFIRLGNEPVHWSVSRKKLYSQDEIFSDGDERFEILHEFDLLLRPVNEANGLYICYVSLVLFGEEFVLNMSGPDLDGFEAWRAGGET